MDQLKKESALVKKVIDDFLFSGEGFSYLDIVKEYSSRGGVLHFFLGSSIGEYAFRLKERNLLKIDYSNTNFYPGNLMPIYFN